LGLLETHSGVLMARRAVAAVAEQATREDTVVPPSLDEAVSGQLSAIRTASGSKLGVTRGGVIIFACGPWLGKILPDLLGNRIFFSRQEIFFFSLPAGDARFAPAALSIWIDLAHEAYGIADLESRGVKAGIDRHGCAFDQIAAAGCPVQKVLPRSAGTWAAVSPRFVMLLWWRRECANTKTPRVEIFCWTAIQLSIMGGFQGEDQATASSTDRLWANTW